MSLISDCLYLTPFDQDRQYRKTRTSLIPAEGRGPFLLSCPIRTILRKSYLPPGIDVADGNERIRWSGQSGRQGAGAAEAPAQAAGEAGRSFSQAQRATADPPDSCVAGGAGGCGCGFCSSGAFAVRFRPRNGRRPNSVSFSDRMP
jgi:hypothetical protein